MRPNLPRTIRLAVVAAAATTLLAACSSGSDAGSAPSASAVVAAPADLVSSGALTFGTAATFPPFEYVDGTETTGFDIEMGEALASYMGLEPERLDIDFNGLIPALKGGRVDMINSAMYINDERSAEVDFVPYLTVGEALLVPTGNEHDIETLPDDLAGRTIAVTAGAIGETYMNQFNEELEADGKEKMTILSLPTNQDALLAVTSGRADGFDTSTPGAAYTQSQQNGVFEIAANFELGTEIGIAVSKGDSETKEAVEAALQEFVDDGSYAELLEKYNLPAESSLFD